MFHWLIIHSYSGLKDNISKKKYHYVSKMLLISLELVGKKSFVCILWQLVYVRVFECIQNPLNLLY
jgi:hypothetical protein